MSEGQWFYDDSGARKGPVSVAEMRELVSKARLRSDSLVWCAGMTDWAPVSQTELALAAVAPPPIHHRSIMPFWAWVLAIIPFFICAYGSELTDADQFKLMMFASIGTAALTILDIAVLRAAGYQKPGYWWALVVGFFSGQFAFIYLFARYRVLRGGKGPLVASVISLLLGFVSIWFQLVKS